jgi:N-carbamoylputrescine amidase
MRVAALGVDCAEPERTWRALRELPDVDLLVLPELAFSPWLCATRDVDPSAWSRAVAGQQLALLSQLRAGVVIGTHATDSAGRHNDAFVWTAEAGLRSVHRKTFLPDEPGYWEASWYDRGPVDFQAFDTPVGRIGVSVCTEMWFTQHSYPDVDLLVVPRATPLETTEKWVAGGVAHAVCSGAFCISSNRAETVDGTTMGGAGWVIDPDGGVLAVTSAQQPVAVVDIDLARSRDAKTTYPRYVHRD